MITSKPKARLGRGDVGMAVFIPLIHEREPSRCLHRPNANSMYTLMYVDTDHVNARDCSRTVRVSLGQ